MRYEDLQKRFSRIVADELAKGGILCNTGTGRYWGGYNAEEIAYIKYPNGTYKQFVLERVTLAVDYEKRTIREEKVNYGECEEWVYFYRLIARDTDKNFDFDFEKCEIYEEYASYNNRYFCAKEDVFEIVGNCARIGRMRYEARCFNDNKWVSVDSLKLAMKLYAIAKHYEGFKRVKFEDLKFSINKHAKRCEVRNLKSERILRIQYGNGGVSAYSAW